MPNLLRRCLFVAVTLLVSNYLYAETGNPRVNQVGYTPNSAKISSYKASSNTAQTWELRQNGNVVANGTTNPQGVDAASGDNVHHIISPLRV